MSKDIQQRKQYRILLIGDSCTDRYHYGTCSRLSPEAPVPVLSHTRTEEMFGMVLNVENNLLAFGDDVDIDVLTNEQSIFKERFVDEKSGQHILRFDSGEDKKLKELNLKEPELKAIAKYDLVIVSDYEKGFITERVAKEICELCLLYDIPIFVDTKKRDLTCFKGSIVKINEKESKLLKTKHPDHQLVVTRGSIGAEWNNKVFGTRQVQVSDVSGAGDTFLAVLSLQYVRFNRQMETAIIMANKASSYVVQKSGTYSLKEEDVEKLRF